MTLVQIKAAIDRAWGDKGIKMDWLQLEDVLVSILNHPTADDSIKVQLSQEAIDAFTKRGRFIQRVCRYCSRSHEVDELRRHEQVCYLNPERVSDSND